MKGLGRLLPDAIDAIDLSSMRCKLYQLHPGRPSSRDITMQRGTLLTKLGMWILGVIVKWFAGK